MADTSGKTLARVGNMADMGDEDEVLHNLGNLLRKITGARWVLAYFFDRDKRVFQQARPCLLPDDAKILSILANAASIPDLFHGGRGAGNFANVDPESLHIPDEDRDVLRRFSLTLVPMKVRGETVGAILFGRIKRAPEMAAEKKETVRAVVSQAGFVVAHLRLFAESLDLSVDLARRIDVILSLDEINKAISSTLSRREIVAAALENLHRVTGCSVAVVFQEERGQLVSGGAWALDVGLAAALKPGSRPGLKSCCVRRAFTGLQDVAVDLTRGTEKGTVEEIMREAGTVFVLTIPLITRGKVKGVLALGTGDSAFSAEGVFTAEKIAAQIAVALENARLYEDLKGLFFATVASLANAIDAKSPWTKGHSERVMRTAGRIAREMGLPEEMVERVEIGGLLHDIGKIGIVERVLEKPDSLSEAESPSMRLHPVKGVSILAPIEQLKDVLPAILHHHERWDGKGYPDRLKGEEIPLAARIVTVADSFDAMVAVRPYKQGRSVEEALKELNACSGTQFDPKVVEVFVRYVERKWNGRKRLEVAAAV